MARACHYCDKKPVVGNKVSHSNIKTKVRHLPNLQKVRALIDGVPSRVYVCTRCLRSGFLAKPAPGTGRSKKSPVEVATTA